MYTQHYKKFMIKINHVYNEAKSYIKENTMKDCLYTIKLGNHIDNLNNSSKNQIHVKYILEKPIRDLPIKSSLHL